MNTLSSIYVKTEHQKITSVFGGLTSIFEGCEQALSPTLLAKYEGIMTLPPVDGIVMTAIGDTVVIGDKTTLNEGSRDVLLQELKTLKPWRKGPFQLCGIDIDTEWVSSIKWNRILPHLPALTGKKMLDVGCSSGYYMFRMAEHQPAFVLGIDPTLAFYFQYRTLNHFSKINSIGMSPIGIQALKPVQKAFDVIFCMGILYHQKHPLDLLKQLKKMLVPGGSLVLETLIMDQPEGHSYPWVLSPKKTYAMMPNVYYIPTIQALNEWLEIAGFQTCKRAFCEPTTLDEQRKTDWIDSYSLDRFLDPNDASKTIEGYPAPIRAALIAS
jgi:tRNA (mo5U34)-methyltransferase